jgi:hypothetical protein
MPTILLCGTTKPNKNRKMAEMKPEENCLGETKTENPLS